MSQHAENQVNRAAPAAPRCARCGREITTDQHVEHVGATYCAGCVGAALDADRARRESGRAGHVVIAVLLSLLPGLGQMYNGQMLKGLATLAVFFFIAMGQGPFANGDLLGASIVILYAWNLFDAYWTAQRIRHVEPPVVPAFAAEQAWDSASAPFWGLVLIGLGIIFLLDNYGVKWLTFQQAWPAALLALGLWLLASFIVSRRAHHSHQESNHDNAS